MRKVEKNAIKLYLTERASVFRRSTACPFFLGREQFRSEDTGLEDAELTATSMDHAGVGRGEARDDLAHVTLVIGRPPQ